MSDAPDLPHGVYEKLVTEALYRKILTFDASTRTTTAAVEPAEAARRFSQHLARVVEHVLAGFTGDQRVSKQAEVINALLSVAIPALATSAADEQLRIPAQELRLVQGLPAVPGLTLPPPIPAPRIPVSSSDLLVNARDEPGLVHNLEREIPSADSIDLICAFVRWHGLRLLEAPLQEHRRLKRPLRVITTVYTGSTERKALDWLVSIGAEVKVSYDTQSTRLHAKAWRFHRESGYSTVYIGSSNLTKSALLDGVEWNVRLSEISSPDILKKFQAAFDSYWSNPDYENYDATRDRDRLDAALSLASEGPAQVPGPAFAFFDIHPHQFQQEMLERLSVERTRHGRHRNLVVAATGTGKTVVAALDFKSLRAQMGEPSLLFVAHRKEILGQALGTFRQVLRDHTFGELDITSGTVRGQRHTRCLAPRRTSRTMANDRSTLFGS